MSYLVYVTLPASADARKIARDVVSLGLAAGVNIIAGESSIYTWAGEIREEKEWIMLAQVSRDAFEAFRDAVLARHPHKVPCILALPVEAGHETFLRWISQNSRLP